MPLATQPYKGARDFYPEDKRRQKYLFDTIRRSVERFGYEEYDAPILESLELYLAKSGEEIVNEQTYAFTDRGGRQVVIRPEMTPSVSRMVAARRQELAYPLRWFSIPNLWRYERPQRGRLREHWQLNVDIFGVAGPAAEQEMILLVDAMLQNFGAKRSMYEIKLSSRQFTDYVLREYIGFDEVQAYSLSKLIDRMHKMDHAAFVTGVDALCSQAQREAGAVEALLTVLQAQRFGALPEKVQSHPSVTVLQELMQRLQSAGISNIVFDPTLMRGFDYYTGIIFEVFDTHPENNRAMLGGGRYDGLVGLFGVEPVPTVGFGCGDVTLANFLDLHELWPTLTPETDAYVVIIGDVAEQAQKVIAEFRAAGLNLAVDITGRKVGAQFQTAEKKHIVYAIILGESELSSGQYVLKNLQTGAEEKHGVDRIVSIVRDYRHPVADED